MGDAVDLDELLPLLRRLKPRRADVVPHRHRPLAAGEECVVGLGHRFPILLRIDQHHLDEEFGVEIVRGQ